MLSTYVGLALTLQGQAQKKIAKHFSGYILVYDVREKKIRLIRVWEVLVLAPFDIDSPLYDSKKNCSVYKVLKTTGLSSRFQRKNWFKKIWNWSRDIG